jgi:pimeloyl-ACP methyl ester carboxylesterase/DNA-binding CsgD family transcriptional regulator
VVVANACRGNGYWTASIGTLMVIATGPRIRYAGAADQVDIAFWTLGHGPPLVYLAGGPWSHVELRQIPECRRWYEHLAQQRMLVRYDQRGTGLSERNISDYSLEALLLDIEAVVNRLGLDRFALLGAADAGPLAIAYAARHPERVSHLVLWCAWSRAADVASPRIRAWRSLLERDWELMTETCAYLCLGWSAGEIGRDAAESLRQNVTREGIRAALEAADAFDTRSLLVQIEAPAVVLHRRDISWLPLSVGIDLTSTLRGARLSVFDGESTAPYLGGTEAIAQAIEDFLHDPEPPAPPVLSATTAPNASFALPAWQRDPGGTGTELTAREIDVVKLVAGGLTNREIADALVLSVRTVERHTRNIYAKLGARGRAHATAYALTRGLV